LRWLLLHVTLLALVANGCAGSGADRRLSQSLKEPSVPNSAPDRTVGAAVVPASFETPGDMVTERAGSSDESPADGAATGESALPPQVSDEATSVDPASQAPSAAVLPLDEVVASVYRSYPLLEAALYRRDMAFGDHLAAHGAFDLKLKGAAEQGPLGFYETYRQNIGVEQPTYWGGALFGGYRIGRGEFQPWYLERQTNDGGEFRAGIAVPLARNITIDSRRAQLWRTNLDRQLAEPEIRQQLIDFVRGASYAYWDWVAAGRRQRIAASLLQIARDRNDAIRRKVETGDTDPPVLQDNRRLIVSREAKLIDTERKLQQSAIKLSLYFRDESGRPVVPSPERLPDFPEASLIDESALGADIETAIANRPELQALELLRRQLQIDFAEARNELLPELQGVISVSQDMGAPASSKNDKSPFELEAALLLEVPAQRRKARGKMTAVDGKLGQLAAKQRMTVDKIGADVQAVYTALLADYRQIVRALESVELADRLAEIERRKFELGESDLLAVNLREQQAAEAQVTAADSYYDYFASRADYRAILALD
jgi:outer membrane protein TolC